MGNQGVCALYEEEPAIANPQQFPKPEVREVKGDIIYYNDESWYKGDIENDEPNGNGTYTRPDKTYYQGQWKDGLPHGQGKEFMESTLVCPLLRPSGFSGRMC